MLCTQQIYYYEIVLDLDIMFLQEIFAVYLDLLTDEILDEFHKNVLCEDSTKGNFQRGNCSYFPLLQEFY